MLYHLFPHRGTGLFGYICSASWIGVDLFFVLSGFLITGILFDTLKTENFYRIFYIRRPLRLFPIYLIFIGIIALLAYFNGIYVGWAIWPYLLYGSNIARFFYPDMVSIGPVHTGHLWSLAVEEQFYLAWPWILAMLGTRRRILGFSLYGIGTALALRLLLAALPLADKKFIYLELPTRADTLLLGAVAAMLYRSPQWMTMLKPARIRFVGLAALLGFIVA